MDTQLERTVAIKVMFANPDNPEFAHRFEREASAMAKLNHPHIVTMHEYGIVGDLHFLVMEWMEGGTLEEEMGRTKTLTVSRAVEIIGQICEALDFAHSNGVIHRDVKPGNILLDRTGIAKLSDFGLVKGLLQEEFAEIALTRTDMAVGTPLYMAPEQMEGATNVDRRADIYSAGAVLYEMLTGEVAKGRYQPVSSFADVPRRFNAVIDRALQPLPNNRYDQISELRAALIAAEKIPWRRAKLVARVAVYLLLAVGVWMIMEQKALQGANAEGEISGDATRGLPLRAFDAEFDLNDWRSIADYDFENGFKISKGMQRDLAAEGNAAVKDGILALESPTDNVSVKIARRETGWPEGLGINLRFLPEEYQLSADSERTLLGFSIGWEAGVFLAQPKWGRGPPTILDGRRQQVAEPGVVEPFLNEGQWHDLWIALDGEGYRIWIDDQPVYRASEPEQLEDWGEWEKTDADLVIGGFRGKVDRVRILVKRRNGEA
ncbi:MAG: protein kinase [Verrucomicrobiales bacterium]